MVVNISAVQYNGGVSPGHYTVDARLLTIGEPG